MEVSKGDILYAVWESEHGWAAIDYAKVVSVNGQTAVVALEQRGTVRSMPVSSLHRTRADANRAMDAICDYNAD